MAKMTQRQKLVMVIANMMAAGYEPKAQLTGYLKTGNAAYITRQGGARELIKEINPTVIKRFLSGKNEVQVA